MCAKLARLLGEVLSASGPRNEKRKSNDSFFQHHLSCFASSEMDRLADLVLYPLNHPFYSVVSVDVLPLDLDLGPLPQFLIIIAPSRSR